MLDFSFFAIVFLSLCMGFRRPRALCVGEVLGGQWEVYGVLLLSFWLVFEFISRGVRAQRPFCLSAIVAFYT